jgi:hypothetical protein
MHSISLALSRIVVAPASGEPTTFQPAAKGRYLVTCDSTVQIALGGTRPAEYAGALLTPMAAVVVDIDGAVVVASMSGADARVGFARMAA